jgi:hypothetical protein
MLYEKNKRGNMWQDTFRKRMEIFESKFLHPSNSFSFSIKIRVTGGCFHREHSPRAYKIIDNYLASFENPDCLFSLEEHESGPEILVFLAVTTAGITLAKSIIDLINTILKARQEGIKKGDDPIAPLELIVRRTQRGEEFFEEKIMKIGPYDLIDREKIKKEIEKAANKLTNKEK